MPADRSLRERAVPYTVFFLLLVCIYLLGYHTVRTDHESLVVLFCASFAALVFLYRSEIPVKILLFGSLVARLLLLLMIPNLSDDIYRFIWDGNLLAAGVDPFLHVPSYYNETGTFPGDLNQALYNLLNSKDYFTVYPPFMQYVFYVSASVAGTDVIQNVVIIRSLILFSEAGLIYLLYRRQPENRRLVLYALNPLIIIEFTGNLHFEAIMLFFLVASFLLLDRDKFLAGISMGLSVTVKMVPLIFAPLLVFSLPLRRSILLLGGLSIVIIVLGLPLISQELLFGMFESLSLYFRKFEFNASIYYVVREIGFWRKGYNDIAYIGPFLGWVTVFIILILSWKYRRVSGIELLEKCGIILSAYLMLATTVHPWYVASLAGLFVFSRLNYGYVWTFAAIFSYMGYTNSGYELPVFWIFVEYILVYFVLFWEVSRQRITVWGN